MICQNLKLTLKRWVQVLTICHFDLNSSFVYILLLLVRCYCSITILMAATLARASALLALYSAAATSSTVEFCVDSEAGYVTTLALECPPGTTPFRHLGTNLFDIFWDAWSESSTANMSTSLKSIRDAGASGFAVARVFASPWAYSPSWAWLNASTREAYWAVVDELIDECARVGVQLIPSLGHGCADGTLECNPASLCPGETYRDLVVNASSCTRGIVVSYAVSFVERYLKSSSILFWELGNELNLAFDGCTYDKSPGSYFTAAEGLTFLDEYAAAVRAADPTRPVNSGMAAPRLRARHLAATPGGGSVCVNAANPRGDCDGFCPEVPFDSQADSVAVFSSYYTNRSASAGPTIASAHWYSCDPPNGNYSWCPEAAGNTTIWPLTVFKQVRAVAAQSCR
jgi:hypothetical protein